MAAAKGELRLEPMGAAETETEPKAEDKTLEIKEKPKEEPKKSEAKEDSTPPPEVKEKVAPIEPEPAEDKAASTSSDSAELEAIAKQAEARRDKTTDADETAKTEAIAKLIEGKQYYVPLHEAGENKPAKMIGWVLGAFLLLAIVAYLAVDADIIDVGFKLPLDLIK